MAQSTCQLTHLMWVHHLLVDIGFGMSSPVQFWCNNEAVVHITSNSVFHERNKLIEVDFVPERIQQTLITTIHVRTDELTKSLSGERIPYICNKLDDQYLCSDST